MTSSIQVDGCRRGPVAVFREKLDDAFGGVDRWGVVDFEVAGEGAGQAQRCTDGRGEDDQPRDDDAPAVAEGEQTQPV